MTLFLGHTRFSIDAYGSAWFNATRTRPSGVSMFESRQEYLDWLYDHDRLERRAKILLEWSLPQLQLAAEQIAAHGHEVRHVVSYSANLPEAFQTRLREAAEQFPLLHLHQTSGVVDGFLPPEEVVHELLDARDSAGGGEAEVFAAYRLDDDDILSTDYFTLLEPYVGAENVGFRVSLGLGFSGVWRDGRLCAARETYYPMISMGMASICSRDTDRWLHVPERYVDASQDNHDLADRGAPVITDSRKPAFFRILHETQSGVLHRTRQLSRHWYADALSRIQHAPPADPDVVAEKFPVLAQAVTVAHGTEGETIELLDEELDLCEERVPFEIQLNRPFVLEVDFTSEQEAISQDIAVKWQVEAEDGFDLHCTECTQQYTRSDVRYHRKYGYTTWVPTRKQFGVTRHAVVDVHPQTRITGLTVLTRGKNPTRLRQIRITEI
ncbi:hypothetical protein HGQ17_13825 [Nesterenkonia sp. MY13]|uniref:Uncharacterized protein n=1 Tax=Nesterenkonia sedimenti TaxID=1463632 RepID=A0A7X8TN20_9MICC|nr:glycosyltransferase [Nesterenkonia sedimenti]NLS11053.1 hypothetical protein [Nesterenkonia sedimenti]